MGIKKRVATASGAAALLAVVAAPAFAAVTYPGGGTWSAGTNSTSVYSDYHHPSVTHRSSTINGYGEYKSSGCKAKKVWARTSDRAKPNAVDNAYWAKNC